MEQRKGDARVSIISAVFFTCIVAGAIFLFLYMLLPGEQAKTWHPIVGLILVAVPWIFWIFTCIYRCCKPNDSTIPTLGSGRYAKTGGNSSHTVTTPPAVSVAPTIGNASTAAVSPVNSPGGEQPRVQFGGVSVLGSDDGNGGQTQKGPEEAPAPYQTIDVDDHHTHGSVGSTDEMPLRLMV